MTTPDAVTAKKSAEPSAEEAAANELVRQVEEQGLSPTGPDGLFKLFTKNMLETALNEEMTEHLGHAPRGAGGTTAATGWVALTIAAVVRPRRRARRRPLVEEVACLDAGLSTLNVRGGVPVKVTLQLLPGGVSSSRLPVYLTGHRLAPLKTRTCPRPPLGQTPAVPNESWATVANDIGK